MMADIDLATAKVLKLDVIDDAYLGFEEWNQQTPTFSWHNDRLIVLAKAPQGGKGIYEVILPTPAQKPSTAKAWRRIAPPWLANRTWAEAVFTAIHEGWDWLVPNFGLAFVPVLAAGLRGPVAALLIFTLARAMSGFITTHFMAGHEGSIDAEGTRLAKHLGWIYAAAVALLAWNPVAGLALLMSGWGYHAVFDTPRLRAPRWTVVSA